MSFLSATGEKELGTFDNPALSAKHLQANEPNADTGLYFIQPNGLNSPRLTFCELDAEGGGWTMSISYSFNNLNATGNGYFNHINPSVTRNQEFSSNASSINFDDFHTGREFARAVRGGQEGVGQRMDRITNNPTQHDSHAQDNFAVVSTDGSTDALYDTYSSSNQPTRGRIRGFDIETYAGSESKWWQRSTSSYENHLDSDGNNIPGSVNSENNFGYMQNSRNSNHFTSGQYVQKFFREETTY